MKTVVCGLGKCGSRMTLDLNAMIWGGQYSYQLRAMEGKSQISPRLYKWLRKMFTQNKGMSAFIREEERPSLHLGDSDNENEVLNLILTSSGDSDEELLRQDLQKQLISFTNYRQACGQYHIVGEQVMSDLMAQNGEVKKMVVDAYINRNSPDNVSCYLLLFSVGGGTGCGTSTILAEQIAKRARDEYANLLVAGLAALPGSQESDNYKVSAGRFLTKFLSSERATSFDTVITISNSIMESLDKDGKMVQSQANVYAAHLICSIINSSSRYNQSPINTDGPELRKNIHDLSYFCYSQEDMSSDNDSQIAINLLKTALQPVHNTPGFDGDAPTGSISFQGASIPFSHSKFYPQEKWDDLLANIDKVRERVQEIEKGDLDSVQKLLKELFPDPNLDLPLAMRSCSNVVVLRGIPENGGKSTQWEQTVLITLLRTLFPKAAIHYYVTYHKMQQDTLTLLPSGYITHELLGFITTYLTNVWSKKATRKQINQLFISPNPVSEKEIVNLLGEREHFEDKYEDFCEIIARTTGLFGLTEADWEDKYVTAAQVAAMVNNVRETITNVKRGNEETEEEDSDDDLLNF